MWRGVLALSSSSSSSTNVTGLLSETTHAVVGQVIASRGSAAADGNYWRAQSQAACHIQYLEIGLCRSIALRVTTACDRETQDVSGRLLFRRLIIAIEGEVIVG